MLYAPGTAEKQSFSRAKPMIFYVLFVLNVKQQKEDKNAEIG